MQQWNAWVASRNDGLPPIRKLFFDHVPKCAGTSIRRFLQRLFSQRRTYGVYSGIESRCRAFKSMPESLRHQFDLVIGHGVHTLVDYVAAEAVTATVLRQPVDRIISHYHYVLREQTHYLHERVVRGQMSLRDYVESGLSDELYNFMTCHYLGVSPAEAEQDGVLSAERALEIVRTRYRVIGILERLPHFMTALCNEIGTDTRWDNTRLNVTASRPKTDSIAPEDYEMIAARNSLDMHFYKRITEIAIDDPVPTDT